MSKEAIGKVTHYYDQAMVVVIRLSDNLKVGETVKFIHRENEFIQPVESMEVEHQKVQSGLPGDEVAIKVNQATHQNAAVYKVE